VRYFADPPGEHHGVLLRGDADRDVDLLEKARRCAGSERSAPWSQAVEVAGDLGKAELDLDIAGAALQAGR
jgi:hypothetical protein